MTTTRVMLHCLLRDGDRGALLEMADSFWFESVADRDYICDDVPEDGAILDAALNWVCDSETDVPELWRALAVAISDHQVALSDEARQRDLDAAEEQRFQRACAVAHRVEELAESVAKATGATFFRAGGGSFYARFHGLKLRVSDHWQVSGGGWSEERQCRMGESDLEWVASESESEIPSREDIRRAVGRAVRTVRTVRRTR